MDPAALDQDHGVFLEVVTDARNVGGDLNPTAEPDACDLP